jgi:cyclophilin family peptidyl-prolyl cis-trans isomerase
MSGRSCVALAQNVAGVSTAWILALMLASTAGCGGGESADSGADAATQVDGSRAAATPVKSIDLKHPVVRIETNQGPITLRLDAVKAPVTVRNFLEYAAQGFYDNTLVHYVDAGKMILAGGYTADRQSKQPQAPIRNEAHNGLKNKRGSIAMARDQSLIDNATSQFFINLADAPHRNHQAPTASQYGYCVFGEVIEGLDVADRIAQTPTTDMGGDLAKTPKTPVLITSIRVVR